MVVSDGGGTSRKCQSARRPEKKSHEEEMPGVREGSQQTAKFNLGPMWEVLGVKFSLNDISCLKGMEESGGA